MGYNINFNLTTDPVDIIKRVELKDLVSSPHILVENSQAVKIVANVIEEVVSMLDYNPFNDPTKWYSWEKDMKDISTHFLDVLFTLTGSGEDDEDMWVAYFKNGKVQVRKAIVTYEAFNEEELV